jgi:hypothetical protein
MRLTRVCYSCPARHWTPKSGHSFGHHWRVRVLTLVAQDEPRSSGYHGLWRDDDRVGAVPLEHGRRDREAEGHTRSGVAERDGEDRSSAQSAQSLKTALESATLATQSSWPNCARPGRTAWHHRKVRTDADRRSWNGHHRNRERVPSKMTVCRERSDDTAR